MTHPYIFRKDLYDKYDMRAKAALKLWIIKNLIDDEETKGPDLIVGETPIVTGNVEVEVKEFGWNEDGTFWPNTVHVLYRKKRLVEKYGECQFFIMNHACTHAIWIDGALLKKEFLKEIPNKRHRSGEYMYDIPIMYCKWVNLREKYLGD
jgi:hypothetical protein